MKNVSYTSYIAWTTLFSFFMVTTGLSAVDIPYSAKIEIDDNGNMVAAWELFQGNTTSIQGAFYTVSSGTWSTPQQLSLANYDCAIPKIAIAPSGQAAVVWLSTNPSTKVNSLFAATISLQNSPVWSTAAIISNPNESVIKMLQEPSYSVKVGGNAKAVALWRTVNLQMETATTTIDGTNSWSAPSTLVGPQ